MAQQISFGIWIQYGRIMARMRNAHPPRSINNFYQQATTPTAMAIVNGHL